jgi:hypothetical protein
MLKMLAKDVDWHEIKADVTYDAIDWIAVIRTNINTIANEPVLVRQSDSGCFVRRYGRYELAETVPGFSRYERRPWRKRLLDTATQEVIEIPLFTN